MVARHGVARMCGMHATDIGWLLVGVALWLCVWRPQLLRDYVHLLQRGKSIDFIELFNDKLLIKQEKSDLCIVDVGVPCHALGGSGAWHLAPACVCTCTPACVLLPTPSRPLGICHSRACTCRSVRVASPAQAHSSALSRVPRSSFATPAAFIFLYGSSLFLTFEGHKVFVWDSSGKVVTKYVHRFAWACV